MGGDMKLKDFVKQSLLDITEAVAEAQEETKLFIAIGVVEGEVQKAPQSVNFEVAVTVSGDAEGVISVLGLGELKGAGVRESISKLTFDIPVHLQFPTRRNKRHPENEGPLDPVPEEKMKS